MAPGRVGEPLRVGGAELSWREHGDGPALLLLHETGSAGAIWDPLVAALGPRARAIVPDRRGWGSSSTPQPYTATTVEEQAADANALLVGVDAGAAVVCGAGLGAVVALELLLRHPERARAGVLIEPPLLAFVAEATEGMGADRQALSDAVADSGPEGGAGLYLSGGLAFLGPGAERIPETLTAGARPLSVFAELGAVPAWPLHGPQMRALTAPVRIVVGSSTPAVLRTAATELTAKLGAADLVELQSDGLPHVTAADQLAELIAKLL